MDIGAKIKAGRLSAGLTQEQAAEAIGVSRQTMSNWENNRTWPDIVSVVKMSDIYNISLDALLKDGGDYVEYLGESTDMVRSNERKARLLLLFSFLAVWAFGLIVFWFFTEPTDALGYSLMFLVLLLPVNIFACSAVIGRSDYFGRWKWAVTLDFGVMYMLAEYATFQAANMASFGKFNLPSFGMIAIGAAVSVLGMALGSLMRKLKRKKT